jgi:serine protease AprX
MRSFRIISLLVCNLLFGFFAVHSAAAIVTPGGDTAPAATWVFFADKNPSMPDGYQQAIAAVESSYDAKAVQRRELRGTVSTLFDTSDLPVATDYIQGVLGTGATLRTSSTWLNAISVEATPGELAAIRAMPFVANTQPVAIGQPQSTPALPVATGAQVTAQATGFYGYTQSQLEQIHIPEVHALGYTGTGVLIGVLDCGFVTTHEAYNQPGHVLNVVDQRNYVSWGTINSSPDHGTATLGIIGGYKPNTYVGGAYGASFLLARTEDVNTETQVEEDNWVAGLQWFESQGADMATSSLGYIDWYTQSQLDGNTAVTTKAAQAAAQRGLVIVDAAGNEGHDSNPATSHLLVPSDAASVISVGAVDSNGTIASFSSDGPTADGRVKPEVLALGVNDSLLQAGSDTGYGYGSGTSFATPLVASAVALIIDAHPDWTVDQIRNALIETASGGGSYDPLYVSGYGVIDTYAAIMVPEPGTVALLLAAGLTALLAVGRRYRRCCSPLCAAE